MKIILDGKKVGNGHPGCYLKNKAYLTKKGLTKRMILHELYHHLIEKTGLEMTRGKEEKEAGKFSKDFFRLIG
jgi:hypothetical protein